MTADEIRALEFTGTPDDTRDLLKEIAAQLADANEARQAKSDVLEELIAELKMFDPPEFAAPVLVSEPAPVLVEPPQTSPVASAAAPAEERPQSAPVASVLAEEQHPAISYLLSKGHDLEKAKQIFANHPNAVLAEMDAHEEEPAPSA